MFDRLLDIAMFLVIVWLLLLIRRTAGFPSVAARARQAVQKLTPMRTSSHRPPTQQNVLPLDQVDPDDAMQAVNDYFKQDQP